MAKKKVDVKEEPKKKPEKPTKFGVEVKPLFGGKPKFGRGVNE